MDGLAHPQSIWPSQSVDLAHLDYFGVAVSLFPAISIIIRRVLSDFWYRKSAVQAGVWLHAALLKITLDRFVTAKAKVWVTPRLYALLDPCCVNEV